MKGTTLLVIARPDLPQLRLLERLPPETRTVVGLDRKKLAQAAPEADVVLNCTGDGTILRDLWPEFRRVRWVHSLSAGVESQVFPELVASAVPLTNARGVYKESLGEFVLAAALFYAKDLRRLVRSQQEARWDPFDSEVLYRQSMGIVGYGEIGRAVARRAKAFGMQIYATRRRPENASNDGLVDRLFRLDDRNAMIAQSDYIVVSAPLTPETRGLIGAAEIAAMKPTAVLINIGRGPVVDESALIEALESRKICGAALDVFDLEPLPPEHPFWRMENVLLSPHSADHIEGWLESAVEFFLTNFERFRKGGPLLNVVDKKAGY
jgi:phosphoglycerate dehydrogenase-like enzyme